MRQKEHWTGNQKTWVLGVVLPPRAVRLWASFFPSLGLGALISTLKGLDSTISTGPSSLKSGIRDDFLGAHELITQIELLFSQDCRLQQLPFVMEVKQTGVEQ